MTLLIVLFSAIITTVIWYLQSFDGSMCLGALCLMYWGAALMWFVDAIFEYIELGAEYFRPAPADMLNDAFLGLSAAALGLMIWLTVLLIKDPKGILKKALIKK